ncbi:beach-domain-containing protein [Suillus weaverae]|nr:beach-domain-containing protein [Suillus weaverae]
MRDMVEDLKVTEAVVAKSTLLQRIATLLREVPQTKDAFRGSDGFLLLVHVLSTLSTAIGRRGSQSTRDVVACIKSVFTVASEALKGHAANLEFFEVCFFVPDGNTMIVTSKTKEFIGYSSLSDAADLLVCNAVTADVTLGCLLALSFGDIFLVEFFSSLRTKLPETEAMHIHFLEFAPCLARISLPGAFSVLWSFTLRTMNTDRVLRLIVYRLLEHLTHSTHRNLAVLSMQNILPHLFKSWKANMSSAGDDDTEHRILAKILRRLFEMGASTQDSRDLLQCTAKQDGTADAEMFELLRSSAKSRWPQHFTLDSCSALVMSSTEMKTFPAHGFTFMAWIWLERMPSEPHKLFSISFGSSDVVALSVGSNGTLALRSRAVQQVEMLPKSKLTTSRWTHVTLVHHNHRSSHPSVCLFVDGVLSDSLRWPYPKFDEMSPATFMVGDDVAAVESSWCVASAYLLSVALDDDLPRFIHHLGPRYSESFQDQTLIRFLTYEASTSLNMHITAQGALLPENSQLKKTIRGDSIISDSSIIFRVVPQPHDKKGQFVTRGDVFTVCCQSLDLAVWRISGAALLLRLVALAQTPHELSRALSVFSDCLRNSWQNSDDMERLHGYDVLASMLRARSHLINMTSFETLFEFLGLDFRSPDLSTVVNTIAYRAVALDFELWSKTSADIQRAHLEHFAFLLRASRYRKFTIKMRLSKLGIVRKLLFAIQSAWYPQESISLVVDTLALVAQSSFTAEEAIKPIVSYIAATLTEESRSSSSSSPRSTTSRGDLQRSSTRDKAEQVLEALVSMMRIPSLHSKLAGTLPMPRICLLLLGSHPSAHTACQVLGMLGLSLKASLSSGKDFESASGWSILKTVLPRVWDRSVHDAALDILPGRAGDRSGDDSGSPQMLSVFLFALYQGLSIGNNNAEPGEAPSKDAIIWILDDLTKLHDSSSSFRRVFRSQSTTQLLLDGLNIFSPMRQPPGALYAKISAKLTHFGILVAMGNHISTSQKQQILDIVRPDTQSKGRPDPVDTSGSRLGLAQADTVCKASARLEEWRKSILVSERKRFRQTLLDLQEKRRRVASFEESVSASTTERDLWPHLARKRVWKLDETEGPHRVRTKMESLLELLVQDPRTPGHEGASSAFDSELLSLSQSELTSPNTVVVPSWTGEDGDHQLAEELTEDKLRRVRHQLEPGDVIEAVSTVCRIAGVDSFLGMLIFGRTHLYMLEGLVENSEGEVIDAGNAPEGLFLISGSAADVRNSQRAQRWSLEQVSGFSNRMFLFQDVGFEIFFKDSCTLLVIFRNGSCRQAASQRLSSIALKSRMSDTSPTPGSIIPKSLLRSRSSTGAIEKELQLAQRRWQKRELSNFGYLSILNQLSGRTPNDATQYPVFPWVLNDYVSEVLDLSSPNVFRDLTKPMGALTAERREAAETRYANLGSVDEEPFHYGTHFSSSMIVCHFNIRIQPFTNMFKTLQGGDWDLPDRLFTDIRRTYSSASHDIRGDVRELIPEFFTCPEFLENSSSLDFGISQTTGERIHDVKLPVWAKGDPLLFIVMHRRVLESYYVSENLPAWIDLIWGCKQRDVESANVFHPLSYEGAIDLDKITDDLERQATVGIIHNFGQTPKKLFTSPHPPRNLEGFLSLPVTIARGVPEDALALARDQKPFKGKYPIVLDSAVSNISVDLFDGKYSDMRPLPRGAIDLPSIGHEQIEWGQNASDRSLRLVSHGKVTQVIEQVAPACAAVADQDTLVTGSGDNIVRVWRVNHGQVAPSGFVGASGRPRRHTSSTLAMTHLLRGHTQRVGCIATSRTWSVIVSGSEDGSAIVWDLNRGSYRHSIWHGNESLRAEVYLSAINESTGYIATCSASHLMLHTINARPIARLDTVHALITSLAFHEREYSHLDILATGHGDGSITLWTWNADGTPAGMQAQWEFVEVRRMNSGEGVSDVALGSVTALKFIGECLCAGYDSGLTYMWTIPT